LNDGQKDGEDKKMKLLVFDVEGTLFQTKLRLPGTVIDSTVWQTIASVLGPEAVEEEVATHGKWHAGKYGSYIDWMKDTLEIHKRHRLLKSDFERVIASAEYNEGVAKTLSQIDRARFETVLVSGGFRELAARAQRDFDIHHAFAACEYFFGENGMLSGYNLLPCDFEGKIDFIHLMLREYRLTPTDWIFVGDGANDVPIAKSAPFSIAYRGHAELRAAASVSIDNFMDLQKFLY
jgi:phosphoserine phosphatase